MRTIKAALASTALICATPALAQDFGAYGYDTMRDLALNYPGRFTGAPDSGTTFFNAAQYMRDRLSFGGDKLDEIYVTSMGRVSHPANHDHFARQVQPQFGAGSLFRITGLGIEGLPEPRFAG